MPTTRVSGATVEVTILIFTNLSKKRSEHNHQECPRGHPTPAGEGPARRPDPPSKLGAWVQMELNPSRKLPHRPSDHRDKNNETRLKTAQPIHLSETDTRLKVAQPIQRITPRHTHQDKKNDTHPGAVHPTQRPKADTVPTCSSIHPGNYPATDPLREHRRPWDA